MVAPLVTKEQLEARIGAQLLQRCADDNNDGQSDPSVVDQILADASGYVRGGMPQYNPADLTPANALVTDELRRLALDAAEMLCAKRRPTVVKRPWMDLKESLDKDLERIMRAQRSLGSNASPTPADTSVSVVSGGTSQANYWP